MPARLTRLTLACVALLVALVGPAASSLADEDARATVTLRVGATARDAATRPYVFKTPPLAVDEAGGVSFTVECFRNGILSVTSKPVPGRSQRSGYSKQVTGPEAGVTGGVVAGTGNAEIAGEYTWTAQVRLVAIAVDTVTVETNWSRSQLVNGNTQRVAGDVRTIKLKAGEHHVLDFVNQPDNPVANLVLDVEGARVEDPANANVVLAYDVWLVHETAAGQKLTRHAQLDAQNAQAARFLFDPFAFPLGANEPIDGTTGPLNLIVGGSIQGRVRSDGGIDVVLHSSLLMGSGVFTKGTTIFADRLEYAPSGSGDKTFAVKPGETIAIEYPNPSGTVYWGAMPVTAPRPGVSVQGAGAAVDDVKYLAGSKTTLLLTVRRKAQGAWRGAGGFRCKLRRTSSYVR